MSKPETVGPTEFGEVMGLSRATVLKYIESGEVPAIRFGGKWLIPRTYLDGLFEAVGCPRAEAAANG